MTSNPDVLRPRPRAIVLLTKLKSTTRMGATRLGATTLAFFRKGDDLEATGFENLPHDDPALVPPKLGFRNFDRVPRRYAPVLTLFLLVLATGLIVLGRHRMPEVRGKADQAVSALATTLSDGWVRVKEMITPSHAAR